MRIHPIENFETKVGCTAKRNTLIAIVDCFIDGGFMASSSRQRNCERKAWSESGYSQNRIVVRQGTTNQIKSKSILVNRLCELSAFSILVPVRSDNNMVFTF